MSRPSRESAVSGIISTNRTFFVTTSTVGKRALLQSERSAGLLIDVLYRYRGEGQYRLHEFVVMPNHLHALLTVSELSIERAMQLVKGGFSYRAARELQFHPPFWEKGFSEVRVTDPVAYSRFCEYIRANPLRRGLVTRVEDFPFCSVHSRYEKDPSPQGLKPDPFWSPCGSAEALP